VLEFKQQLKISLNYFWIPMKKLLPLTAIALHLSISLSVNAQDFPPAEEPILLAELAPPAIPALSPPASRATAQAKNKAKPIEPIAALPAAPPLLAAKRVKPQPEDPLGDLVHTLMMEPLPLDDLLAKPPAPHPVADLAKPRTADPLGDLADVLEAPLVLEPVPPASIDPLDDLAKIRAASPR
jgi:hypothetical protein